LEENALDARRKRRHTRVPLFLVADLRRSDIDENRTLAIGEMLADPLGPGRRADLFVIRMVQHIGRLEIVIGEIRVRLLRVTETPAFQNAPEAGNRGEMLFRVP